MLKLNYSPKTAIILLFALFLISSTGIRSSAADKELSAKDFLYRTRHPAGRKRWALMDGKVFHRRRGKETVQANLYLGILFNKDRTLAQLLINDSQGYMVGQDFSKGKDGTSVIPLNKATKDQPILGNFGLRPEDLTMSFLYWGLGKELKEETTKMISCRVFQLNSPDKKETATVWISKKYYFPLKVKWTKASQKDPFRSLEVSSFKTQGEYGVIKRLELYGPGWRTRINFTKIEIGTPKTGSVREGLFRKLK